MSDQEITDGEGEETVADALVTTSEGVTTSASNVLAEAEARLAEVIATQQDWADEDLHALMEACSAAESDTDNRVKHLEVAFAKAHNLKGMGSSFGYELVTEIGGALCNYLRENPDGDTRIVTVHAQSLKHILDESIQGDGGEKGQTLMDGLRELIRNGNGTAGLQE
jgi:hypothetical protein